MYCYTTFVRNLNKYAADTKGTLFWHWHKAERTWDLLKIQFEKSQVPSLLDQLWSTFLTFYVQNNFELSTTPTYIGPNSKISFWRRRKKGTVNTNHTNSFSSVKVHEQQYYHNHLHSARHILIKSLLVKIWTQNRKHDDAHRPPWPQAWFWRSWLYSTISPQTVQIHTIHYTQQLKGNTDKHKPRDRQNIFVIKHCRATALIAL